jgi:hypothetical protein
VCCGGHIEHTYMPSSVGGQGLSVFERQEGCIRLHLYIESGCATCIDLNVVYRLRRGEGFVARALPCRVPNTLEPSTLISVS